MTNDLSALTPRQLESQGKTAYGEAEYLKAANIFSAAEEGYRTKGDEKKAAEMANNRSVALIQAGENQEALDAVKETIDVFKNTGDKLHQAMALGNRAVAFDALGHYDLAVSDYENAEEIFRQLGENDMRLEISKSLSVLQMRQGKALHALNTMQAGVSNIEKPSLKQRLLKKLLSLPSRFLRG